MKTLVAAVLLVAALLLALYHTNSFPFTTLLTTTTTSTTTTTTSTTTTTLFEPGMIPAGFSADNVTDEAVEWLERRTFELVNEERTERGLSELKWNEEVAAVCRAHSRNMAENGFFSHTGSDGLNVSGRLKGAELYYWNMSGENILMESGVDYYALNLLGMVRNVEYKTLEELAQSAVVGWMNSTGHRENILKPEFDESAMGVYVLQGTMGESLGTSHSNVSYYFTQDFITRIDCGYKDGQCCRTAGYMPWCYVPWKCENGICG